MSKNMKCELIMIHVILLLMLVYLWSCNFCSSTIFFFFFCHFLRLSSNILLFLSYSVFFLWGCWLSLLDCSILLCLCISRICCCSILFFISLGGHKSKPFYKPSDFKICISAIIGYEKLSASGCFVFLRFKYKKTQVTRKWRMKQEVIFHLKRSQFG